MVERGGEMVEVGKYYMTLANFPATEQGRKDAETFQGFAEHENYDATVNTYQLSSGATGGYLVWSTQPFSTEVGDAMKMIKDVQGLQDNFEEMQNKTFRFQRPRFLEQPGN